MPYQKIKPSNPDSFDGKGDKSDRLDLFRMAEASEIIICDNQSSNSVSYPSEEEKNQSISTKRLLGEFAESSKAPSRMPDSESASGMASASKPSRPGIEQIDESSSEDSDSKEIKLLNEEVQKSQPYGYEGVIKRRSSLPLPMVSGR